MFDFATNQTVEDINTVPEQFRGAYVEDKDAGGFKLGETTAGLVESIAGLNKALGASRKEAKDLKGKVVDPKTILSEIGEFEDAASVKARIDELTEAAAKGSNINLDKIKADNNRAVEDLKATHAAELESMGKSLSKYMISSAAAMELTEHGGNAKLLMPHIASKAQVVKEGDDYVVRVLDVDGDYRTDGKGGFMGIKDLITEMKGSTDFAAAFSSEAGTGGGKKPGTSQKPGNARKTGADMTSREKIAQGLKDRQK